MKSILTPLEFLLLRIINEMPSMKSIYYITRFWGKTDITLTVYEELKNLVDKKLLALHDMNAQVKSYYVTSEGKQLIKDHYDTNHIKDFVLEIEPTGFILDLLHKIDLKNLNNI